VRGSLNMPGDKSVSHRLAMLTGLASGSCTVTGFLESEDCLSTLAAMQALGADVRREAGVLHVGGTGGALRCPEAALDLGNSGTGMRLLAGILAGQPFVSELTGDASLRSRPMRRIQEPLVRMGARVELLGEGGCAPVRIEGGRLHGMRYELPVASAQVKSCVLLAGLFADGMVEVVEPGPTRDHTERLLHALGVDLEIDGLTIRMQGRQALHGDRETWQVPGDFSSAAFWFVAAACRGGSEVTVRGVGLNPRRTAVLDVLRRMGADVATRVSDADPGDGVWEPCGDVTVRGGGLRATQVGGDEIPNLIDELPLVAVAGAMAEGETVVRDAAELRVKESDRIAAIADCLRAFGVDVEERDDGFSVCGTGGALSSSEPHVDSRGDHRIAMAAAVLSLFTKRAATISQVACIETSYPGFWKDMQRLAT
jgi:3-phosphoshikimate 1-carboxyvinyltransferase